MSEIGVGKLGQCWNGTLVHGVFHASDNSRVAKKKEKNREKRLDNGFKMSHARICKRVDEIGHLRLHNVRLCQERRRQYHFGTSSYIMPRVPRLIEL